MIEALALLGGICIGALLPFARNSYRRRWREATSIIERQQEYTEALEAQLDRMGATIEGENAKLNRIAVEARTARAVLRSQMEGDLRRRTRERDYKSLPLAHQGRHSA